MSEMGEITFLIIQAARKALDAGLVVPGLEQRTLLAIEDVERVAQPARQYDHPGRYAAYRETVERMASVMPGTGPQPITCGMHCGCMTRAHCDTHGRCVHDTLAELDVDAAIRGYAPVAEVEIWR